MNPLEVDSPVIQPGSADEPPMAAEAGEEVFVFPATASQHRFWSLDQLRPGDPSLNMPLAWRCRGRIDADLLSEACSRLVARHEVLRTTFEWTDGQLHQVIAAPAPVVVEVNDLESLTEPERDREVERLIHAEACMSMDLREGPLFFCRVLRLRESEHILLVTLHHVICDGWSNGIVLRDLAQIYDAIFLGRQPDLPALPIQFADFSQWQADWLAGEESQASFAHWRRMLGEELPVLALEKDFPLTAGDGSKGEIETLLIPEPLARQAREFCRREDSTLYMLLLAVFAVTLRRWSGQDDFLVGSPCANRRSETENLIGCFANPQVMRARFRPDTSFLALVAEVRQWTLGAYSHQDLPFECLLDDPHFSAAQNRIKLQVYFLYQKAFMRPQHLAGLEIAPLRSVSPGAMFDLMLGVVERDEGPRLQLEYNPGFYRASTIARWLRVYVTVLEAALTEPSKPVMELALVKGDERTRMLADWNRTEAVFPGSAVLHEAIEEQSAITPDATAAVCGGTVWTYRELSERSNRLARYLRRQGVREGTLVGVCLHRSLDMLAAVLAVVKAGGAYVPLDPRHPVDRLAQVLADAQTAVLITEERLAAGFHTEARIVCVDSEQALVARESGARLESESRPDSLAYVIYTSGSTGKPKGVAIEHRALMNLLRSMEREPGLRASDVLVAVTTLSFDIAALELFLPLLAGARVVIATAEQAADGYQLFDLLRTSHATILQATPATWRILIEAGWRGDPPLKMLCGGEALPRELANQLLNCGPELWNMYGPTETTVWSSATRVEPGTGPVVIGPPIANTQFYVLDEHREPVPVGVVGELYIGGAGLARGYWHRPELTAEKFLPNPFGEGRIYRSGDLARYQEGGTIQLLGRTDFQVKVRGYRIELGDIESTLRKHDAVREAVVVAQEDGVGYQRLVAYVEVGAAEVERSSAIETECLHVLRSALPDYMVPSWVVVLADLPRNTNGKIDRRSLPKRHTPDLTHEPRVASRDSVERKLTEIWESVLGVRGLGIRSNFFDLGGNSLLILRLMPRVNTAFEALLPIPTIFAAPTIEKMAEVIRSSRNGTKQVLLPLQPAGSRPPLFMIQAYHLYRALPASLGADQPFYGLQQPELSPRDYPHDLTSLISTYTEQIRRVQGHGPYHIAGFCFSAMLAVEVAARLESLGEEVAVLALVDANCPYYWLRSKAEASGAPVPVRDVWKKRGAIVRHHLAKLRGRSLGHRFGYLSRFAATKFWNQCLNLNLAAQMKVYGYFLSRPKPLPPFLNNKLMVAQVRVKQETPKTIHSDIYLFQAQDQPCVDGFDETFGWGRISTGKVHLTWIPGTHDNMFLGENLEHLARELRAAIDSAPVEQYPAR